MSRSLRSAAFALIAANLACGVAGEATAQAPQAPAAAQAPAGKVVFLRIGWPPGSGNNTIGRLVADHLGRHMPGQPKIVAQNMPGAATFVLANYLYNVAPRDGSVLGYISQTAATEELLANPAVQFKTARFGWIGRVTSYDVVHTTWHTTKVKTIADAMTYETTAGADSVGSTVYNYPYVMNRVLGTKFKLVTGYEGTAATALAMERGEVEGISTGWFTIKTARRDWLDGHKVNILVQVIGTRHPDLPDVPTIVELARTPQERQLFQRYASEGELGKAIVAPPDLPSATLAMLRKAFDEMTADPDYIADADKMQVERAPLSGEKLQAMLAQVAKTPPETVAWAKSLFK